MVSRETTATKGNWAGLQDAFKERYFPQDIDRWKQTSQGWSMKLRTCQSAVDCMSAVEVEAVRAGMDVTN